MIDWTKPLRNRAGSKSFKVLSTEASGEQPVIVLETLSSGQDRVLRYTIGGKYYPSSESQSYLDLHNIPVYHTVYLNCYPDTGDMGFVHPTRKEADRQAMPGRIACVKAVYKEGQYDD